MGRFAFVQSSAHKYAPYQVPGTTALTFHQELIQRFLGKRHRLEVPADRVAVPEQLAWVFEQRGIPDKDMKARSTGQPPIVSVVFAELL